MHLTISVCGFVVSQILQALFFLMPLLLQAGGASP